MQEIEKKSANGLSVAIVLAVTILAALFAITRFIDAAALLPMLVMAVVVALLAFLFVGLYQVEPNQSAVLSFFGKYSGTSTEQGLRWNNPLFSKRKVSLRVRNFESGKLKVNDLEGSPIEIASIVVWQVVDSAEAVFNVDDFESFVQIQAESALRSMAGSYPYDNQDETAPALRSHPQLISESLQQRIQERVAEAGVRVVEARISHLAYAPEVAQAMLQRQQASAIVAARERIVEGAVGMVDMALATLKQQNVVEMDANQRAALVSNLMVVLCSDSGTQPVVNAGASD